MDNYTQANEQRHWHWRLATSIQQKCVHFSNSIWRWRAPLLAFAAGQPAIQLLNLFTGLLLLRWMTIEDYAQFGVAFAFQSTVSMLVDLGFSSSILALAGTRGTDPEIVGRYVRSARHYRAIMVVVVGLIFAATFPIVTSTQNWGTATKVSILISILVSVCAQGWAMYQAPLLAHRKISELYKPQIATSGLRLAISGVLYSFNALNGVLATWVSTLTLVINGFWTKKLSKNYVIEPSRPDADANREMIAYLSPLIPGIIFTAFQSQVLILIATFFGSTQNIAEVTALGRLGQLFVILGAFNGVIIGPHIALLDASRLKSRYFSIVFVAIMIASTLTAIAFVFPQPLLWLLGYRYRMLGPEIGWMVFGSSISYVGGVLWTMHAARKWIYWWGTILYIALLLLTQILGLFLFDLETTMGVVLFGTLTAIAVLFVHIAAGAYGLMHNPSIRDQPTK